MGAVMRNTSNMMLARNDLLRSMIDKEEFTRNYKEMSIYGHSVEGLDGNMVYLVFDSLELVSDWDKSCTILPLLFRLNDVLKVDGVGLVFVSGASIDTYHSNTSFVDPVPVYFSDYTEEDLRQIFMRNQSNLKLRSAFLE
ncbi:origin of replication complex subunit 5 [Tanacetum coccineum]